MTASPVTVKPALVGLADAMADAMRDTLRLHVAAMPRGHKCAHEYFKMTVALNNYELYRSLTPAAPATGGAA